MKRLRGLLRYGTFAFMKLYRIDELRYQDYEKLRDYLPGRFTEGGLPGIFHIPIDSDQLTEEQSEHMECQPYYCAVELEEDQISVEFLVRSSRRMRCSCIGYANEPTRAWLIGLMDEIFSTLGIIS
jgi:hypothetical protein